MGGLTAFVLYSVEVVPEQVELLEDSVKTLGGGSDRSSAGAATVLAAAAEKRSVVTAVVVVISLVSSVTSSDSFSNGSVWRATAAESCGESCCCVPVSLSLPEDVAVVVVVISVSITSNIVKSDLPLGPRVSVKRKPEERHKQGRTQDWRPNGVHFAKSTNHVQIAGPS
jgi:hypothetical protein